MTSIGGPRKALLAVAALALTLSACSGNSSPSSTTSAGPLNLSDLQTTTPAGTGPVTGIKWNLPYEPHSIDPVYSFNYAENTVIANMCDSLLRLTPALSIEPGLAQTVNHPDPKTWIYQIHSGIKFWDGTPLTANDVAYSLNRNIDPTIGSYYSSYFTNVASIQATGPLQVTVKLKSPDSLFNESMASAAGAIGEKAFMQTAGKAYGTPKGGVMCTGPFEFGNWSPGQSLTLNRNPNYWDSALKAKSPSIAFSFIGDESTAVNALRSGGIDGEFFYLPPAGLSQLQTSAGKVTFGKTLTFWSLVGASTTGPFADPRIRQALLLATDRAAIAKVVFQGGAVPAPVLTSPGYFGYEQDMFQKAYDAQPGTSPDLAKAKELFAAAGSPTTPITIGVQGSSAVHEQTGDLLKAEGQAIGLNINIKVIPVQQFGNLYTDPKARAGLDAFLTTWYGNIPDPLDVYSVFTTGGPNNYNGYDTVNTLINQARAATTDAQRAQLTIQAQAQVTKDLPWLPLEYLPIILFQGPRITGAVSSFAYLYYPWASLIGTK